MRMPLPCSIVYWAELKMVRLNMGREFQPIYKLLNLWTKYSTN